MQEKNAILGQAGGAGIGIVHESVAYLEGLKAILVNAGHTILGTASTVNHAESLLRKNTFRLVFAGGRVNGTDVMNVLGLWRHLSPQSAFVVVSDRVDQVCRSRAFLCGAHDCMESAASVCEILATVKRGLEGRSAGRPTGGVVPLLSVRELEILELIAEGYGSKEIAMRLNLSSRTISCHKENMKIKLNLPSTREILQFAIAHRKAGTHLHAMCAN